MPGEIDFAKLLPAVIVHLWGDPKSRTPREWRWGSKGGKMMVPAKGVWQDHSTDHGTINEGGTIALITRETGREGQDAVEWLVEHGFITEEQAKAGRPPRDQKKTHNPVRKRDPDPHPPTNGKYAPDEAGERLDEAPPFDPNLEATFGSEPAGDFEERQTAPSAITTPRALAATYDYTDPQGSLLYQVQRWEWLEGGKRRKMFVQRRPYDAEPNVWIVGLNPGEYMRRNPGDDWQRFDADKAEKYNLRQRTTFGGTPHALYRVEELREAVSAGETVFLPEGEKKVEALRDVGLPATTNSGGAANWTHDFSEFFRDADVVIPVDCDEPGRKRGQVVAASLYATAKRVRVLDFQEFTSDPLPGKYDIADWLAAGNDAEKLFAFVERIERWEPPKFRSKFGAVPYNELDTAGPEHEWLIRQLLTRGERSMMAGPSGSGKTFAAMHLAFSVLLGRDFFGRRTLRGGVIYQAGEGGKGVKKRIRAVRQEYGLDPAEKLPFVLLTSPIDLYANEDQTNDFIAECKHWASTFEIPLELIVIDTWSAATPGADENSSRDVGPVLARCERISSALNAHVMLVHHMNADGTKVRGHTSIAANIDSVMIVRKQEGKRDASDTHRQLRELVVTKVKDGEEGQRWDFVLKSIRLGYDADNEPITSCVVIPPDMGEMAGVDTTEDAGFTLSPQAAVLLRAVYMAIDRQGTLPPGELRLPQNVKAVEWKHVQEEFGKTWFDESGETGDQDAPDYADRRKAAMRKAIARHGQVLVAKQVIGRADPWIWLTGKKVKGFRVPASAERQPKPKPAPPKEPTREISSDDVLDFIGGGMDN